MTSVGLASLGAMGATFGVPENPCVHHKNMVPRCVRGALNWTHIKPVFRSTDHQTEKKNHIRCPRDLRLSA